MRGSLFVVAALVCVFFCTERAEADLPVHCLHKHVRGTWTFHLGINNNDKNGLQCSKTQIFGDYGGKENNYGLGEPKFKPVKQIQVHLSSPNVAKTTIGGKEHTGTWTMIYDEGFEVNVGGTKFFAFSKYRSDANSHYSQCDKTFPGWYHPAKAVDKKKWGCYFGVKHGKVPEVKYRKFGDKPMPIGAPAASSFHSDEDVYVPEDELVAEVNNRKTTWTAKRYAEFEGRPIKDVQRTMGTVLPSYKLNPEDRAEQQGWVSELQVDVSDLPKKWDWTNVNGQDFVGPVMNQGACGSCFSVAVAEMFTSRIRVASKNKVQKTISPDRVVKCSPYAQGCHGGFPYLASKHYQDFGGVTLTQQPYTGMDGKCPKIADKDMSTRATGYQYIGGYYGACKEKAMMRELFDHGPVVVGFEVGMGFNTYSGGVFKAEEKLPEKNHWERVNHAVLIVGYGTQNGVPYWRVKNSWGSFWGESGFFKIKRGDDNLNIEHMAVAAYPTVGHEFPPKKGSIFMEQGTKSWGHHYMTVTGAATAAVQTKSKTTAKTHRRAESHKIEDPAFARSAAKDSHRDSDREKLFKRGPAVETEEVQQLPDEIVPETVADSVVEEDAAEWPQA
jgi:cathepsin C